MAYFALIQFELWNEQDVAAWLKGLDDAVHQYIPTFVEERVDGKKLLMLTHSDLDKLEVTKLGHQELILEGVDLLKSLRYTFETENLQHLALQLGCKARSLHNEILAKNSENDPNRANILPSRHHRRQLSISVLSSTCDIMTTLKTLTSWLDRSPFEGIYDINLLRNSIVKLGLELVTVAQRESGVTEVENVIVKTCKDLTEYCDSLVLNMKESLVVQPASLEIATIRKKQDDELGMNILSSYLGVHVIGFIKDMSPADLCSRIEKGDEVIQVNNQTVLGWQLAKLVAALRERPKEVTMLLKKRPRHTNPFGNVPNRRQPRHIPSVATLPKALKKRRSRDGEKPARPTLQVYVTSSVPTGDVYIKEPPEDTNDGNDTDNEVFRSGSESPQFTLPVTVDAKQRRATVSGGSPTFERPSLVVEDLDPPPVRPKSQAINLLEREAVIASLLAAENSLMKKPSGEKDKSESANTSSSENRDVSTSTSSTLKDEDGTSTSDEVDGSSLRTEEPKEKENVKVETERADLETNFIVTKPIPTLRESSSSQKSWNRHQRIISTEVAGDNTMKGDIPQLMRIKRLDSSQISDLEAKMEDDVFMKPSKKVGFSEETVEPEKPESYTHIVVGGVVQKIPLDKTGTNSSDGAVKMRNKSSGGKRLDRRVSCKDLGKGDCEGWLYKGRHKGTLSKSWAKRWCVLKNFNLFYYKQKDDLKAEGVIHLPAFQVSPAPKTKKFAFKIHNSGTTFYFRSESQEDMSKWMNKMGLAAITYDASKDVTTGGFIKPERQQNPPLGVRNVYYSESEDEEETGERWQGSAMSLASSSSVGSMQSPQSSPVVKRHALKDVKERVGASTEELQSMLHSIQKQDLTIDGKDKKALRQSQCKAAADVIDGPSLTEVERLRKLQSLQRTLRAKEIELQDINRLMSETVTSSKLVQFVDTHQDVDAAD